MSPIPLWVEPCAGSLAVGLRLLGLPRLVGWMGGKGGYADAILHALHLQPRQGAREVWLADVSDWSFCWEALAQPGVAHRAADLIDEWRTCYGVASPRQVRALWDDLLPRWRAEGTPPDAEGAARAVATFTEGETIDLFEPCPFCGSWLGCIVRTERYGTPPPGAQPHEGWWSFTARCGSCSAEGPPSTASEAGALERWERRA